MAGTMKTKKLPKELKKVNVTIKLRPSLISWMREQDISQAKLIEKAMLTMYGVE